MGKISQDSLVGRTIAGKFRVEEFIGSGAMGAVFRAKQIALDKTVAIKVLHGEHADDPTFAARFQREAKAASRLNHPNSMQVIDFGAEPDGLLYIAMEYLDGRSLHRVLREDGRLPPARIADILMQTLAALAVAHDEGVVHRDLKPENIVVLKGTDDDGRVRDLVKVCDFGIAKITDSRAYRGTPERDSNAPVTTSGFLVGTPEYMSPEQSRGDKLDARSDIYSVGVILFEMLAGRVPFEAENAIGVVLKHITEEPPRPSRLSPGVDPRLEAVCMRALKKRLQDRYPSAREMRTDLRLVVEGRAPMASVPDGSVPGIRVSTGEGAHETAATERLPVAAVSARTLEDGPPKPTLTGTTAGVIGRPRRLGIVALLATLVGAVATVLTVVVLSRTGHGRPAPSAASAGATTEPSTAVIAALPVTTGGDVPPLEPSPAGEPSGKPTSRAAHGAASAAATGRSAGEAAGAASAAASAAVTPPAPASASAAGPALAPASASTSAPEPATGPASASAAAAAPAPDTSFDPDHAYVEVGLINAQGVRESAVRGALRGVGLAGCYRRALKAQGTRAVGVATLNLSIDENGQTRSAIATGAGFLPGLARCVQGAAAGVTVAKSQVDSGGGTAEVTLAFKAP